MRCHVRISYPATQVYVHRVESYVTYYSCSLFDSRYARFVLDDVPQISLFGFMTQHSVFNEIHILSH